MDKITFVLTLKINANPLGSDLERVKKILFPSIVKYFNLSQISRFLIIVPASDQDEVIRQLQEVKERLNVTILNEEKILELIPGWKKDRIARGLTRYLGKIDNKLNCGGRLSRCMKSREGWSALGGWWRQQLLKIFVARLVDTDYYMVVDSDLCLMRPVDLKTLFPDGKAIFGRDRLKNKYDWWVGSAGVLDIPLRIEKEEEVISVTPQILSTPVVNRLAGYLISKSKEKGARTVFEYLSKNSSWTEYTLYWLFLLECYKKDDYYTDQRQEYTLHASRSVWFRDQAPNLKIIRERIDSAFRQENALFLIIQSACIPVAEYCEAIKGHVSPDFDVNLPVSAPRHA